MENTSSVKKKKRKHSLAWKTAVYVICFGLLLGGTSTFLSYRTYWDTLKNELKSYAFGLAKTAGAIVVTEDMDEISPMDENDPEYLEIMGGLENIQKNTALSHLLVTKEENGKTIVLFDVGHADHATHPGTAIDLNEHMNIKSVSSERMKDSGVVTETVDGKTRSMTMVLPIKNGAGKTLCYVSASIPVNTINAMKINYLTKTALHLMGITALLTALAVWLTKMGIVDPIHHVTKTAKNIAVRSDITEEEIRELREFKTGDEIEDLCEVIAGMKQDVIHYMDQLQKEIAEKERQKAELSMAKDIQEGMLPYEFPNCKELEIYASMCPAKLVGGDFYDFYYLDEDHLVLTIADVSGKGMPAALFMAIAKALLKNTMITTRSTEKTLEITNELLLDSNAAEMFVTVWTGILEISTGRMICTSAGHEFPAILRANGEFELYHDHHCLALAAMDGINYKSYELEFCPGDRLFVYTDGVPEATAENGELYGTDRLIKALNQTKEARPCELADAVRKDIDLFVGEAPQFDDITMLVMDYHGSQT